MNKPCKLAKVKGGEALRTDEVVGMFEHEPMRGQRFTMAAAPLTPGAFARLVTTSLVEKIVPGDYGEVIVHTENSVYAFTDLSHIKPNPTDLGQSLVDTMKCLPDGSGLTWDDFFDANCIPKEDRSDFAVAAILRRATEDLGFSFTSGPSIKKG